MGPPHIITFDTFNNCVYNYDKKKNVWIPLQLRAQQRNHNLFGFQTIKPIFWRGLGGSFSQQPVNDESPEDDDFYDPSDDDASTLAFMPSMEVFQTKMQLPLSSSA